MSSSESEIVNKLNEKDFIKKNYVAVVNLF